MNLLLPTVSLAAAFQPEASIFGFLMTVMEFFGALMICCLYPRLHEFQRDFETNSLQKVKCFNKLAFLFGAFCMLGVLVVANFRIPLDQ